MNLQVIREHNTDYHKYYYLKANEYGLIYIDNDKEKNEWWLVHASTVKFLMKYENGIVSGLVKFCV